MKKNALQNPIQDASNMQIVLAWTIDEYEVINTNRRVDLGERPRFRTVQVPRAAIWINRGTERDVVKAEQYAKGQGPEYRVFTYSKERDPLGRAKCEVMMKGNDNA